MSRGTEGFGGSRQLPRRSAVPKTLRSKTKVKTDNFFAELKRRNVYKVAIAYIVGGWALSQGIAQVFPVFDVPNWVIRLIVLLIIIGLPVALVLAWMFEITPEGIKRTETADAMPASAKPKKYVWLYIVAIGVAASIGLFLLGRYSATTPRQSEAATTSAKSIAVLPFDNLSRDPDNAYFCEGVQDEILTRLAKVADLKVIARTSTQKFKSAPDDLRNVANQLGVMNVLEGSVQKANDQVRVDVQLINAMTNAHLWAEIYDRKLTDIFAVESDIAKTIADTLQAKLTGSEKTAIAKEPTTDTKAYDFYHKGHALWERRSGDNIPKAIGYYEQAIARDPNYALAYAGLAESYILLPGYAGADLRSVSFKAKEAALKALRLDRHLAEAHEALGKVLFLSEIDIAGSMREYQRAIELKPNDATAHQWLGNDSLAALGRFDEAIAEGRRAVELDPLSPIINADLGENLYFARRYDESVRQFRKTLEIDPTFFYARYKLGIVLEVTGNLPGAIGEYEKAQQLSDNLRPRVLLAVAKAKSGDKEAAARMVAELAELSQHRYVDSFLRALLNLGLNNREEAIRWLEQGVANHEGLLIGSIKVNPLLDPLRGDPRFEALVQKVVGEKK